MMNKKQPAGAVTYFNKAIAADATSHLGYYYRGLGQLQGAIRPGLDVGGGAVIGTLPARPGATLDYATVAAGGEVVDGDLNAVVRQPRAGEADNVRAFV